MVESRLALETEAEMLFTYTEKFKVVVEELSKIHYPELNSPTVRNWEVEQLLDEYLTVTGEVPEPYELALLSNYILADILKDPSNYKVAQYEYPIRTSYSERITPTREYANEADILDFLFSKYQLDMDSLKRVENYNRGFED